MFYQWLLQGAFRRKYKAGPMQEKGPGSWTALLFWAIRWKIETSFGSLGFHFRIHHEAMILFLSVLLQIAHPLVADLAWISRPTCSSSELQIGPWHWWKNREVGIQSCSPGKSGELSTASSTSLCDPQWSGRALGKCVLSPLLWRVEGTSESQTLHGFPTRKLYCV